MGSLVRLSGLAKRFGDVTAVQPLDLAVEPGELAVIVGPSGCGKTTVLRMIAGLEEPTAGTVWIGDRNVTELEPAERDIAMVFQNYALYPHMTVRENLGFGLKMRRVPRATRDAAVGRAAAILALERLLDRKPAQLSGGERQRVALGRALVREPSVFLFDEPLSNLDAQLRLEMRNEIAALHHRLGATMIFVTHDQVEAMTLGTRIAVLRDGVLQQDAAPLAVYREPANLFVARFMGTPTVNTLAGALAEQDGGMVFRAPGLALPGLPHAYRGPATLGVRPEALALLAPDDAAEAHFAALVVRRELLGSELLVHLDGPVGMAWIARTDPAARYGVGDRVSVRILTDRAHVFDSDGVRLVPVR